MRIKQHENFCLTRGTLSGHRVSKRMDLVRIHLYPAIRRAFGGGIFSRRVRDGFVVNSATRQESKLKKSRASDYLLSTFEACIVGTRQFDDNRPTGFCLDVRVAKADTSQSSGQHIQHGMLNGLGSCLTSIGEQLAA